MLIFITKESKKTLFRLKITLQTLQTGTILINVCLQILQIDMILINVTLQTLQTGTI